MRKGLVVTLSSAALLVFGCVEAPPDDVLTGSADLDDAQLAKAASEIIGGATTSGYPAVGALTYDGEPFCTGTVIAPRKVVTAAHCVVDMLPREVKFVLGANAYSPDTVLSVSALRAHPYYDDWSLDNDIGLVTLAADAPVAPVGLLGDMDGSFIGERFIFVGFGVSNGYRQTGAGVKRAVTIPIAEVAPTQFTTTAAGVNTCSGDSGGPAFYTHPSGTLLLAGTTSYGDEYCVEYGTDMRVDPYLSFLGVAAWTPPAPDAGEGEGEGAEGEGEAAEGEGEAAEGEGEGEAAEGEGEAAEGEGEAAEGEGEAAEGEGEAAEGEGEAVDPLADSLLEVEPNDDRRDATPIPEPTLFHGWIEDPDDEDYYRIVLPAQATLELYLVMPEDVDFDVALYNSSGSRLARSQNYAGVPEDLRYQNTANGERVLYLRVYGYGGDWSLTSYAAAISW